MSLRDEHQECMSDFNEDSDWGMAWRFARPISQKPAPISAVCVLANPSRSPSVTSLPLPSQRSLPLPLHSLHITNPSNFFHLYQLLTNIENQTDYHYRYKEKGWHGREGRPRDERRRQNRPRTKMDLKYMQEAGKENEEPEQTGVRQREKGQKYAGG